MFLKDYGELRPFDNLDELFDRDKVISFPLRRGRARMGVDVLTGKRTEDRVTAGHLQNTGKFYNVQETFRQGGFL